MCSCVVVGLVARGLTRSRVDATSATRQPGGTARSCKSKEKGEKEKEKKHSHLFHRHRDPKSSTLIYPNKKAHPTCRSEQSIHPHIPSHPIHPTIVIHQRHPRIHPSIHTHLPYCTKKTKTTSHTGNQKEDGKKRKKKMDPTSHYAPIVERDKPP